MKRVTLIVCLALLAGFSYGQTTLGAYTFNDNQFGNSVTDSDSGTHGNGNWLNTSPVNPGSPGRLTGAHFETGIANIGPNIRYTIGYNTPISNGVGSDLAVVMARYDSHDAFISFSTDGVNFGAEQFLARTSFVDSGEDRSYYYGSPSNGPFAASLYVREVDLSDYGYTALDSIVAIKIGVSDGGDLIRVAGLNPVPEPATLSLLGLGLVAALRKKRRSS